MTAAPVVAGDLDAEDVLSTAAAAHQVGCPSEAAFWMWARRRGLRPLTRVRVGRSWRAVWSLDAVLDADARGATRGPVEQ